MKNHEKQEKSGLRAKFSTRAWKKCGRAKFSTIRAKFSTDVLIQVAAFWCCVGFAACGLRCVWVEGFAVSGLLRCVWASLCAGFVVCGLSVWALLWACWVSKLRCFFCETSL